jgi:hypothetical protein
MGLGRSESDVGDPEKSCRSGTHSWVPDGESLPIRESMRAQGLRQRGEGEALPPPSSWTAVQVVTDSYGEREEEGIRCLILVAKYFPDEQGQNTQDGEGAGHCREREGSSDSEPLHTPGISLGLPGQELSLQCSVAPTPVSSQGVGSRW